MSDNFDSFAYSTDLVSGGFPREQAEALASVMFRLIDSQLVSRSYLDQRLAEFKVELIQWVFGALLVQSGLIIGAIKLL
jgi:hypothetical protein